MIISYNWLNSFFEENLPKPKELSDELTLHVFETELPIKDGEDYALDVGVLPDRGSDALCHLGIARECSAIFKYKLKNLETDFQEDESLKINQALEVEVRAKDCIRYEARVLKDVKIEASPKWMQERLKTCGISPINNVVDVTNYVMLELGQPLHAFDYEKLNKKIIIDYAKKESFTALGGVKYDLDENILTIRDEKEALAIAGIKGGEKAEIDENTKTIILEAANFNHSLIAKTSKKLKLRTDSSFRFEHDLDPELTFKALNRATYLIQKLTGATVLKGAIDIYEKKEEVKDIFLNLDDLDKVLGTHIEIDEIKRILKSLEFKILKEEGQKIQVQVPLFRRDVQIQENLIEEIGRMFGYDKIKGVLPIVEAKVIRNENVYWQNNFRLVLKELGFSEVYNYSFASKEDKEKFNLSNLVEIENPLTVDALYLRNSLIPNLIKNLKLNLKYQKGIKLYEMGNVFKKENDFSEKKLFSGIVLEDNYSVLKGYLEEIFNEFGIYDIEYLPNRNPGFFSFRKSAIMKINQKKIGVLGHLSQHVLSELDLKINPVLFEFDFETIQKEASTKNEYVPISTYPLATRDLSVIVPSRAHAGEIMDTIMVSETKLIKDIDFMDIYDNFEEAKKSITFRIFFQANDRSLSSKEINQIQDKIINNLEQNPEWEVKK